jgi:CheY-like chemotaxis protein
MAEPLALVVYEKVLPGIKLVNRLEDQGYRVHTFHDPAALVGHAEREKPMLALVDLGRKSAENCAAISQLRQNQATAHLPVIALVPPADAQAQEAARAAGATLVVHDSTILAHLDQFLAQALELD